MKSIRAKQSLQTVQLFFLCSAVFLGISVLVALVAGADSTSISYVLVSSLLSSGAMAVLFTTVQRSSIRLRSRKVLPDTLGVRPVAEHELPADYNHVIQQCIDAVKKLRGVRSWNVDAEQGVITASVGMSFLSWGETVRIEIQPAGENVRVQVSSTPKLPTTLVDYGKNLRNVEAVLRQLGGRQKGR